MKNPIILYQSKYGATKQYATWLSEQLSCGMIETKQAKISEILQYDTIILGGGLYAGGIAGISFIKNHYDKLKNKSIFIFAVGASPDNEEIIKELQKRYQKGVLKNLPMFYCRGAWNEDIMTRKDRLLCSMLKKVVSKKDPADQEPWESALMQALGKNCNWTDKENLRPILATLSAEP